MKKNKLNSQFLNNVSNSKSLGTRIAKNLGFTLMEVLIAMAIGVVILVGALSYFGTGVRSMQTADAYARMHENASRAAGIISRDIQLAGFYGYGGSANPRNIMNEDGNLFSAGGNFIPPYNVATHYANASQCGGRYILPLQTDDRAFPIEYYPNKTQFAAALASSLPSSGGSLNVDSCVPDIADDSPVIVMRGALEGIMLDDYSILSLKFPPEGAISNKRLYVAAVPTANIDAQNVIFFFGRGSSETSVANLRRFSWSQAWTDELIQKKASGDYFPIFPYQFRVYYIRSYFETAGDNIPTLVRRQITEGATEYTVSTQIERMVTGVEKMNLIWGVDFRGSKKVNTDEVIGDGVTDYWTTSLPSNDFGNINAVRMQVLMRSPTIDPAYNDRTSTYFFDGVGGSSSSFNCANIEASYPQSCRHRRMLYETSSSVRNCSLRRRAGILKSGGC